jgi:hypothetical protein
MRSSKTAATSNWLSLVALTATACAAETAPQPAAGAAAFAAATALPVTAPGIMALVDDDQPVDPGVCDDPSGPAAARARSALSILGVEGDSGRVRACGSCHAVGNATQTEWWRFATQTVYEECLKPELSLTARQRVECLRRDASGEDVGFNPSRLGIYAAGVANDHFRELFREAYPQGFESAYEEFVNATRMPPRGPSQVTEPQLEELLGWMRDGTPGLACVTSERDRPTSCRPEISAELRNHVQAMQRGGWQARNIDAELDMFGCAPGSDALTCFSASRNGRPVFPEATTTAVGAQWQSNQVPGVVRVLRELPFDTSYWMRTSADGRFVGNGGSPSHITDLAAELDGNHRDIAVDAAYDPGFFPDNSGFVFQGTPQDTGVCSQDLLQRREVSHINFSEPECAGSDALSSGLYQSVGASLDGGDYLVVAGTSWMGDGGGYDSRDAPPEFDRFSTMTFTPLLHTGRRYEPLAPTTIILPYVGNMSISPANRLLVGVVSGRDNAGNTTHLGYRMYLVDRRQRGDGYDFAARQVGSVCTPGNKPMVSYDERMFTTYHYVDEDDYRELGYTSASDRGFQELLSVGAANIYVTDMLTGTTRRVTTMGPGQMALFPHFRSDGWLYFLLIDQRSSKRYILASDAAIRIARDQLP